MPTWSLIIAVVMPLVTITGFILTIVWNVRKHRESREESAKRAQEVAVQEAEERGKMAERQATMEHQIDAAHEKIRDLDKRQNEADTKIIELSRDVKHILKSVDVLVDLHTKKE